MTERQRFEKMLKERLMVDDAWEIVDVVHDFLNSKADKLKETEPYATTSIKEYEQAAWTVFNMLDY